MCIHPPSPPPPPTHPIHIPDPKYVPQYTSYNADPIAAYPLKKVDRIYAAYHRTVANIVPETYLKTIKAEQNGMMDYIPFRVCNAFACAFWPAFIWETTSMCTLA